MSTHLRAVKLNNNVKRKPAFSNSLGSNLAMFADRRSAYDRRDCLEPSLMPKRGCRRIHNRRDRTTFTQNWWLHTRYVDWEE